MRISSLSLLLLHRLKAIRMEEDHSRTQIGKINELLGSSLASEGSSFSLPSTYSDKQALDREFAADFFFDQRFKKFSLFLCTQHTMRL
jgi:hypothetical protein